MTNIYTAPIAFDEDKNFSLVQYTQGTSLSSRIVLLDSELVETQEIMRNQFAKAVKSIAGKNRIFVYSPETALSVSITPTIPTSTTQVNSSSFEFSISNVFLWTELGYIKHPDPLTITLGAINSQVTTFIGFEVYETLITGVADPDIVDSRTNTPTANRRRLDIRLIAEDNALPSLSSNVNEYNNIYIPLGSFIREDNNPNQGWHSSTIDVVNEFARGNEIGLFDLSGSLNYNDVGASVAVPTEYLPADISRIQFAKIRDLGGEIFKATSTRFVNDDTDLEYDVDILKIPNANIASFTPNVGNTKNELLLQFPTTLEIKDDYTNVSITGATKIIAPPGSSSPVVGEPTAVYFDPIMNEKASRYNALLAQGNNFLFSKYSGLFFYPEDADDALPLQNDLIGPTVGATSATIYTSHSNGFAHFNSTGTHTVLETKNMIKDITATFSEFMILYEAELGNNSITFEYQSNLSATWFPVAANVIVPGNILFTSLKIRAILQGIGEAKLKSLALFHSPLSSPNIIRSNTANWQEIASSTTGIYTLVNKYTPTVDPNPSQIEVFSFDNTNNIWTKLIRDDAALHVAGYYEEIDSQTINTHIIDPLGKIFVKPISSAIDTNDNNGLNIVELRNDLATLDSKLSRFFLNNEPTSVGVFKEINIEQGSTNLEIKASNTTERLTYKFSYNNVLDSYRPANDLSANNSTGTANAFKTLSFYAPWGTFSAGGSNPENPSVGTGNGNTFTFSQDADIAKIMFRNTYYKRLKGDSTIGLLGIPLNIILGDGLYPEELDTAGNLKVGTYIGQGLQYVGTGLAPRRIDANISIDTGLMFGDGGVTNIFPLGQIALNVMPSNIIKFDQPIPLKPAALYADIFSSNNSQNNNIITDTTAAITDTDPVTAMRFSKFVFNLPNTANHFEVKGLTHFLTQADTANGLRILPTGYIRNNTHSSMVDDSWTITFFEDPTNNASQLNLSCSIRKVTSFSLAQLTATNIAVPAASNLPTSPSSLTSYSIGMTLPATQTQLNSDNGALNTYLNSVTIETNKTIDRLESIITSLVSNNFATGDKVVLTIMTGIV